jgi:type II secretion system protein N
LIRSPPNGDVGRGNRTHSAPEPSKLALARSTSIELPPATSGLARCSTGAAGAMVSATRGGLVRWSGCAALGLVTFAAGVQLAFPYPRLQERLVAALAAYEIRVDRLTRGWRPGRFALHGVRVATRRPAPVALTFDRVDLDVEIGALLDGHLEMTVDATGPHGRVEGSIDERPDGIAVDLALTDVPPRLLVGSIALVGSPALHIRMILPGGRMATSRGAIEVACDDCAIASPRVQLGSVRGRLAVTDGVACISELRARSADGELELAGGVRFGDDLAGAQAEMIAHVRLAAPPADSPAWAAAPKLADGRAVFAARGRPGTQVWAPAAHADARADCAAIGSALVPAANPALAIPAPAIPASAGALPSTAGAIEPTSGALAAPVQADAGPPPIRFEPEILPPPPARPEEAPAPQLHIEY